MAAVIHEEIEVAGHRPAETDDGTGEADVPKTAPPRQDGQRAQDDAELQAELAEVEAVGTVMKRLALAELALAFLVELRRLPLRLVHRLLVLVDLALPALHRPGTFLVSAG